MCHSSSEGWHNLEKMIYMQLNLALHILLIQFFSMSLILGERTFGIKLIVHKLATSSIVVTP
jgi:hypothetical protein